MLLLIPLILVAIPAILLALNLAVVPPTNTDYATMAYNKAMSAYYQTGTAPSTASVMGATVNVGVLDTMDLGYQDVDTLAWKRTNVQQAILTVCNQIMTRCNTADLPTLWGFLPSNTGTVASLLSQPNTSMSLVCDTPSTYAPFALYAFQHSIAPEDISPTVGGRTYTLYYSRPSAGQGCLFGDIIYAQ